MTAVKAHAPCARIGARNPFISVAEEQADRIALPAFAQVYTVPCAAVGLKITFE